MILKICLYDKREGHSKKRNDNRYYKKGDLNEDRKIRRRIKLKYSTGEHINGKVGRHIYYSLSIYVR